MVKDAADGSRTIASSARRCRMIVSVSTIASLGNPGRPPCDLDSGHRRTRRCQSDPLRRLSNETIRLDSICEIEMPSYYNFWNLYIHACNSSGSIRLLSLRLREFFANVSALPIEGIAPQPRASTQFGPPPSTAINNGHDGVYLSAVLKTHLISE